MSLVAPKKEDLFQISSILDSNTKKKTAYIVLNKETNQVDVIRELSELMKYPNDTEFLFQWNGEWSSTIFGLTVLDMKFELGLRQVGKE